MDYNFSYAVHYKFLQHKIVYWKVEKIMAKIDKSWKSIRMQFKNYSFFIAALVLFVFIFSEILIGY